MQGIQPVLNQLRVIGLEVDEVLQADRRIGGLERLGNVAGHRRVAISRDELSLPLCARGDCIQPGDAERGQLLDLFADPCHQPGKVVPRIGDDPVVEPIGPFDGEAPAVDPAFGRTGKPQWGEVKQTGRCDRNDLVRILQRERASRVLTDQADVRDPIEYRHTIRDFVGEHACDAFALSHRWHRLCTSTNLRVNLVTCDLPGGQVRPCAATTSSTALTFSAGMAGGR